MTGQFPPFFGNVFDLSSIFRFARVNDRETGLRVTSGGWLLSLIDLDLGTTLGWCLEMGRALFTA